MKNNRKGGFTLIELLVVITIIAILASIAVPVYNTVTEKAKIAKVTSNMKQVILACRVFATDWDGSLPNSDIDTGGGAAALATSGDAWSQLAETSTLKAPLYWTANARNCAGAQPVIDSTMPIDNTMNYFAYVEYLTDSDEGALPVAWESGDTDGVANWTKSAGHPWTKAFVVGYLDGSAGAINVNADDGTPVGTAGTNFTTVVGTLGGGTNADGGAEYRMKNVQLNP